MQASRPENGAILKMPKRCDFMLRPQNEKSLAVKFLSAKFGFTPPPPPKRTQNEEKLYKSVENPQKRDLMDETILWDIWAFLKKDVTILSSGKRQKTRKSRVQQTIRVQ